MPYEAGGTRHETVATKEVEHGAACIEDGFPGVAFKSQEPGRYVDPADRTTIEVGEPFVIQVGGIHEITRPTGADVGEPLWIRESDNAILRDETGTNEVQTLTLDCTGGTFTLEFDGEVTAAIAASAVLPTSAAVLAALEALSNIAPGDVTVSGSDGGPYTITFLGTYRETNVPALVADGALLTGGAGTAIIATSVAGVGVKKFGRITELDTARGVARVNANARDTF